MKILENYAAQSGVDIPDKPHTFPTNYHPILVKRYITLAPKTGQPSKDYSYWQNVIDFLAPVFNKHEIQIVQLGDSGEPYIRGCNPKMGLSFRESCFLVQNAELHLSGDSALCHFAGSAKTPVVALYGATLPAAVSPYWSDICVALRGSDGLPSYQAEENPREIDKIKPEEVANSVFKVLGLKEKLDLKTLYLGNRNNKPQINFIPEVNVDFPKLAETRMVIRMDIAFNEQVAFAMLQHRKKLTTVQTKEFMSADLLRVAKPFISRVIQLLDDGFDMAGLENLKTSGVPYTLVWCGDKDQLPDVRLQCLHFEPVFTKKENRLDFVTSGSKFRTSQTFIGRGGDFPTLWHYQKGVKPQGELKVGDAINSDEFWEGVEALYIYE